MNPIPDDDDLVSVIRPGRDRVQMRWAQWCENRDRYERAGFSVELPQPKKMQPVREVISSPQNNEEDMAAWGDESLLSRLFEEYEDDDESVEGLEPLAYRRWARHFIRDLRLRGKYYVLSDRQKDSIIKLIRAAR